MPSPTVPRKPLTCANPACGKLFRPAANWGRQRYCCHPCSVAARPRWSRVLAGRKAGATKRQAREVRMSNIRKSEYRRGYADGWEACLAAMDASYARETAAIERRPALAKPA